MAHPEIRKLQNFRLNILGVFKKIGDVSVEFRMQQL